ncbi:metalloprotease [Saltwater crocodilepox virus]|nr:metalloprotease [Saltwater crocodilepox virus]AVD69430.1 metalloprotease [Saltwater crocodilepox virus]QGT46534.1 ORF095 [Saltwater crocodilepox virus]QGT46750.1 ORF095 [Saltwater crocodilepox virus]QGT46966.1 ORF095 [Saltwater crocodilepox virus]
MILLSNGVRVFLMPEMRKDVYVGIANFGFERDIDDVLGISHLLEHILIDFDHERFAGNATTSRTYMSFWCCALRDATYMDAVRTAVSWFFGPDGRLRTNFQRVPVENFVRELENEYYFRCESFHCFDVLTYLGGGDLYNGGRATMLRDLPRVRRLLGRRMRAISAHSVVIFVRHMNREVFALIDATFGRLPAYPALIGPDRGVSGNKIVFTPSPFFTVYVRVPNTIENLIALCCVSSIYLFVNYETVLGELYVSISFVDEDGYEEFINDVFSENPENRFDEYGVANFSYGDDDLMALYLNFPSVQRDLTEYVYYCYRRHRQLIDALWHDLAAAARRRDVVIIYPSFAEPLFNAVDGQRHRLLLADIRPSDSALAGAPPREAGESAPPPPPPRPADDCRPRRRPWPRRAAARQNVTVPYRHSHYLDYAALFGALARLKLGRVELRRDGRGLSLRHDLAQADLDKVFTADAFVRYRNSKPALLYIDIFLAYFASGRSIEAILSNTDALSFISARDDKINLKFGRNKAYRITTRSSFVCGVVRGKRVSPSLISRFMWDLKRLGYLYNLECVKILPRTYYLFAFSVCPESILRYLAAALKSEKFCFVVSARGAEEDFSALKKRTTVAL